MLFIIGTLPPPYNHENTTNYCDLLYRNARNKVDGDLKLNKDGTLSVFSINSNGVKTPVQLSKTCCEFFSQQSVAAGGQSYFFNIEKQTCNWSTGATTSVVCEADIPFKVVLNPRGNDGTIFYFENDENCSLMVDFDYLFKFDCAELRELILRHPSTPADVKSLNKSISDTRKALADQLVICSGLTSQFNQKSLAYTNTPYSVTCNEVVTETNTLTRAPITVFNGQTETNPFLSTTRITPLSSSSTLLTSFGTTGFGTRSPYTRSSGIPIAPRITLTVPKHYCIKEPDGLAFWKVVLDGVGPDNYDRFIAGDKTSYTCENVKRLTQNSNGIFVYECRVPFGTKQKLKTELDALNISLTECNAKTEELTSKLTDLLAVFDDEITACETPVGIFENLDVWVNIEVVNSGGTLDLVFSENLFPIIGKGNLHSYLSGHTGKNTGFYVCGLPLINETQVTGCTPLKLTSQNNAETFFGSTFVNTAYCDSVNDNILAALFVESKFPDNQFEAFVNTLDINAFNSDWLHYHKLLDSNIDADIIKKIANKKIKVSFTFSSSCSSVSVLIDQISLDKICVDIDTTITVFDKSPGFELERIIDNKKSWLNNEELAEREFLVSNAQGSNTIRRTDYDSTNERLIVNTKEIDLAIDIAKAIETDVWCYISDNPCLLTGTTALNPCMSCNTTTIDIDTLLTSDVSTIKTVEGFHNTMISELIDVKNRKVIQSYPTLKALYERYLNSSAYCETNSSAFNYYSMEQFVNLLGTYWVDLIEQVVPSTTIWDSVKIYTNTLFDQQKFRYKPYRLMYGPSPFAGRTLSNPINGTSGVCFSAEVITTTIVGPLVSTIQPIIPRINSIFGGVNTIFGTDTGLVRAPIQLIATGPNSFRTISSFTSSVVTRRIPTTYQSVCISQFSYGSEFIGNVRVEAGVTPIPRALQPFNYPFNANTNNLITE